VAVHSLRRGAAEAIEAVVHGDAESSRIAGRRIEEIPLPSGTIIGALVRGEQVIMAHHDTRIESGDHIILFVTSKRVVPQVERLIQVSAGFL
jgi:trk system potassium uptake protein